MKSYENRMYVVLAIMFFIGLIYLMRLFFIQVVDNSYKSSAKNQALRYVTEYPTRGLIYGRNGKLLVYNEAAYDLMVIPKRLQVFDTSAMASILGIEQDLILERLKDASSYSRYKASIFEKQISAEDYAAISEQLYKFPGFFGQKRTLRKYPRKAAAHALGYISEISPFQLEQDDYYKKGDYIGISGLEKFYEEQLRGSRGQKVLVVDVHNTVKGNYAGGKYDTAAVPGLNLHSSIDLELQAYGERLMQGKRGSIVAIEPSTGEILCMVASPGYDPNLLVGRDRSKNYRALAANDTLTPLFNRAINAEYRPGSIFKIVQSLIALQDGLITANTRIACNRGIIGCHGSHSNDKLVEAIQHSCNPYFYEVYRRMIQRGEKKSIFQDSESGIIKWRKSVQRFGFGRPIEIDIPGVLGGTVPGDAFYDRWYGDDRWAFSTIYSNSIGEGELGVVPIQMANLAATIANRGYYYLPHLVQSVGDSGRALKPYTEKQQSGVDPQHFEPIVQAMSKVVNETGGTAGRARMDSIEVCGKTGTVQNDPWPDHSVFIAFAPRENPKIAIATYVEYSDFGGVWAAPISSLMMEKYIYGKVVRKEKEQRVFDAQFLEIYDRPQ
ncbi:MAG TPA: peptidoglycan glycosyltransferase [Flavobacteriales bacterium]|jgi:penicillin-binding protein 2|nr:penicillin-binding transpeptidase domain-containing protein [Salibacteraceae bacterium]HAS36651.1 peptidoglycan glycosyltransferase [Flavobacteriales bacterium]